jgi:hypothetical protein
LSSKAYAIILELWQQNGHNFQDSHSQKLQAGTDGAVSSLLKQKGEKEDATYSRREKAAKGRAS